MPDASSAPKRPPPAKRKARPARSRQEAAGRDGSNWFDLALAVIQSPVGAAQSTTERLVGELVRGGNLGQREAERLVREVKSTRERAQLRAQQESERVDHFIERRIEDVLNRVNIPSRSDIERLNRSVETLTRKVETLIAREARGGRA
jgi:poly(hydroxyalkanoate) granule-associated protein